MKPKLTTDSSTVVFALVISYPRFVEGQMFCGVHISNTTRSTHRTVMNDLARKDRSSCRRVKSERSASQPRPASSFHGWPACPAVHSTVTADEVPRMHLSTASSLTAGPSWPLTLEMACSESTCRTTGSPFWPNSAPIRECTRDTPTKYQQVPQYHIQL